MSARVLALAAALAATGCGNPLEPSPVSKNIVCPTGCVLPPGCQAVLSPTNHPVGYKIICDGPIKP